jgi:tetratricopeptide (TPR) repeat protein
MGRITTILMLYIGITYAGFSLTSGQADGVPPIGEILEQASHNIEQLEPPETRLRPLNQLSIVYATSGDQQRSTATFQRILDIINAAKNDGHIGVDGQDGSTPWKIYVLVNEIALEQMRAGHKSNMMIAINRARQVTESLPSDEDRFTSWLTIAVALIQSGDASGATTIREKAFQVADGLKEPDYHKARWWLETARVQIDQKDSAREAVIQAVGLSDTILDKVARIKTLSSASEILVRLKDEKALSETLHKVFIVIDDLPDGDGDSAALQKATVLTTVAEAQAKAADTKHASQTLQQAIKIIDTIKHEPEKSGAMQNLASTQARMGNIKAAFLTEGNIQDNEYQTVSLPYIAQAQIQSGDFKGAIETANLIGKTDSIRKNLILENIAVAQATAGDLKGSLETVNRLNDPKAFHSGFGFEAVAEARIRANQTEATYDWAMSLASLQDKAYALLGIAEGLLSDHTT